MNAGSKPRFDLSVLRELAGAAVFARGEAYFRDGLVEILSLEAERVLAEVAGSEDYRTLVAGGGRQIAGECSCPAFDDRGFCKHMVATALAANAAGAEVDGDGALARIRRHLRRQGADALVEMIVARAERDRAFWRRLELVAVAADGDDAALERRLRKAIDAATRVSGYVEYRQAAGWADGVDEVLDVLAELAAGPRADLMPRLAAHAHDRIEAAIEGVDDSDGHCGALLQRAAEIHLAACAAARPDPVTLARFLFERETEGGYGSFLGAAERYADVLGEAGLCEYRRLATAAWEALPARTAARDRRPAYDGDYHCLAGILDFFAERDGDLAARVALRKKHLSSPASYLQLAAFCRGQGQAEEALRYVEEGLWLFEDGRPDERLVQLAVELLREAGREQDAAAHLWRAFEKAPSLDLYARLDEAARSRALTRLHEWAVAGRPTGWGHPADLLVQVLMRESRFEEALAAIRAHGASIHLRAELARVSEAEHPAEALELYAAEVESLLGYGGDNAYRKAVNLIGHMAGLRDRAAQERYVVELKTRHRRKRNFMKLLG